MKLKLAWVVAIFMFASALFAQDDASVVRGPVMMELPFDDMQLQIEYVDIADYDKLPEGTFIWGHAYFFAKGYPQNERYKNRDADTVFSRLRPQEERSAMDLFMTYHSDGWWFPGGMVPLNCKFPQCDSPISQDPNVMFVVGGDPEGCMGNTIMTGYSEVTRIGRSVYTKPPYDIHTVHEPIKDVRWIGRLNGTESLFLITLISPFPVTADERRDVIETFAKTCGLE